MALSPRRSMRLLKMTVVSNSVVASTSVSRKRRREESQAVSPARSGLSSGRSRHAKPPSSPIAIATITAENLAQQLAADDETQTHTSSKSKKRKKIIAEPKVDDYPPRVQNEWKIGAHVSSAGGAENAVLHAASIGANAFALFLKSQRKWVSSDLTPESIDLFKSRLKTFGYSPEHILPHGSYLINLGNPDASKREKSYECFLDDLRRCELLGLGLYNFHPGSTIGQTTLDNSISLIAGCINRAHNETRGVVILLENMAGAGNVIGSRFDELKSIIDKVVDKSRIGVCLDTCHLFVSGYDIREREAYEAVLLEFETKIGIRYLRGMHLNDSKAEMGSKRDRHENIGLGTLGFRPFVHILTDPRMRNIPLVLETPSFENEDVWRVEIGVLNRLSEKSSSSFSGCDDGVISGVAEADVDVENNAETNNNANVWIGMGNEIRDAVRLAEKGKKKNSSSKGEKVVRKKIIGAVEDDDEENGNSD